MTSRFLSAAVLLCNALFYGFCSAENWPQWRGPRGDGTSLESHVPVKWNGTTGEGITWKVPLPGRGHSSPIVWQDRLFVTACEEQSQERLLFCIQRSDGSLLWQRSVVEAGLEKKHVLNSFASSTPSTDGETVYVSFLESDQTEAPAKNVSTPKMLTPGSMVVAAYDFDGNQRWLVRPSPFSSVHGYCSSPIIFEDLLIINGDHDGESHVLALHRDNGQIAWKFPRVHQTRSYCTPLIRDVAGKTQMVLSGSKQIVSLDPRTGKVHWFIEGPTEQFVASMVFDGEKFYMSAGFPDHYVMAIRPDGEGDVTESHVDWSITEAKCYVPSPVVVGKRLFVADDRGTLNCFSTKDGTRLWIDRLGGHYSASLVTANGLVYCTADDGKVSVVRSGDQLDLVSSNPLGEQSFASPAIADSTLYIRGEKHLFAIKGASAQE